MPDYTQTRSEYLEIMMGDRKKALAPYRPEQINDLGDTSFDVASLSDEDINSAIKQMTGTQYENSEVFKSLSAEQSSRKAKSEQENANKPWWQQFGDFISNVGTSITEGILNVVDSVYDFGIGAAAGIFGGGFFGAQNDFTDWAAKAMTDDRWIAYATKAMTIADVFDKDFWTNGGGFWTDWSYENLAAQQARDYEDQEWVRKGGNFVGELVPSLLLAYFTGGANVGVQAAAQGGLGFARAYGTSSSRALEEGATFQQSAGYGALSGSIEAAFSAGSAAVGGMLASKGSQGFMKVASNNFANAMTQKFGKGIGTAAGKAMEIALNAFGEATEETIENLLDPAFRMIYDQDAWYSAYGTSENRAAYMQEVGKAAILAAVGSIVAGGLKEGVEIGKRGTADYVADYQEEVGRSVKYQQLKKTHPGLAKEYIAGQIKYAKLQQEENNFQRRIENMKQDAIKSGKATLDAEGKVVINDADLKTRIDDMVADHTAKMKPKFDKWVSQYEYSYNQAAKVIGASMEQGGSDVETDLQPVKSSDIPLTTEQASDGSTMTFYSPIIKSPSDLEGIITSIQEADGPKLVRLPVAESVTYDDVVVDVSKLTNAEVSGLSNIKPEDVKVSQDGNTKYANIANDAIVVFNGEDAGEIVHAEPNAEGTGMFYKINGEEVPAVGVALTPKQEVETKYGASAKETNPSIIIKAANAKEGTVWNYSDAKKLTGMIDKAVLDMVDDNSLPDAFRQKYKSLLNRGDLTAEVFTQANLSSEADVNMIRDYVKNDVLDSEVRVEVDDTKGTYALRDLLTTDEIKSLNKVMDEAFDEFIANGRTSKYSKLIEEYENRIERMLNENTRIRDRAKLATTTSKAFNSLANKLGLNGRPSQVKAILKNASPEDVAIVDMFREVVKGTDVSSRTGLSTSPIAAERLMRFADEYTYQKYGHTYLWDDAVRMELAAIKFLASEYTVKDTDGIQKTRFGFHPYTELDTEVQTHIKNLFQAINSKLNQETYRVYQQNQQTAGESVLLYSKTTPVKRIPFVSKAVDSAMSFATYAADFIGKENPAYDALVTDWAKANGTQLSYQQKYANAMNKIIQEEGFKVSKGLDFLKKRVTFQGQKMTKGEAASIYFSALTKKGIADGDNELVLYNKRTESKSTVVKLNGKTDLKTLRGMFTDSELRVMERLQKEVIGGVMQKDFVNWFQKKYGYTPDVSDDYFMLSADTAKAELNSENDTGKGLTVMGETWGRARSRQEYHGSYRIVDFRNQFANYGNDLAHHIGYSEYIDKARVILQTKVEVGGKKRSLNELLGRNASNWSGKNGWQEYFDYIATDSTAFDKGMDGALGKIMSVGQTSVLGLNPRSMAKQWLSDFTVMGDVGIGTYLKSKGRVPYNLSHYKAVRDFMINANNMIDTTSPDFAEYEPYFALVRERFLNEGAIKGKLSTGAVDGLAGKIADVALKGMAFFDEANNVINVWSAAETLAHDYDGLGYGTQANKLQAMKYFVDLVFRTQSNNNAMYVSQLRSGYAGPIRRLLFGMFASDNQNKLQQVDAFTREFYRANRRKKEYQAVIDNLSSSEADVEAAQKAIDYIDKNYSQKMFAKKSSGVIAGLALSGLGAALINEMFDRILAKKDKDGNVKKIADGLDFATIASEAPLEMFVNWIPYVGTFANAIYNKTDVSFFTADRLNGIKDAFANLTTALSSGDSAKIGKATTSFALTMAEILGVPLNNVYKYTKGIIRNASESTYVKAFGWMDGLRSNDVSSSFKASVARNDISGAADVLGISYSLYKTGNVDREVLVEQSKLTREGFNSLARNVPDYIQNEDGERVVLNSDQKADFGIVYSRSNKVVANLIKSSKYKNMDSETKAKSIKKVYDLYYETARYKALGIEPDSRLGKLLAYAGDYDGDILATLLLIQQNSELTDNRQYTKKEQALRIVNQQSMPKAQKLLTLYLMGYGVTSENKKMVKSYLTSIGFKKEQVDEFIPS